MPYDYLALIVDYAKAKRAFHDEIETEQGWTERWNALRGMEELLIHIAKTEGRN